MDVSSLNDEKRSAAAESVAEFLRSLHSFIPPPEVGSRLPREDPRLVAEEYFARTKREIMPKLASSNASHARNVLETYLKTPGNFTFQPVVLHADLSRDHILMVNDAVIAAIDFGDVNWGDPDYDFTYLLLDFGQAFAEDVARRYGHRNLKQLRKKLHYFALVDQIGTILDGQGRALQGEEELAWHRLHQLLRN